MLKSHLPFLTNVFRIATSKGKNFPFLDQHEFKNFCVSCEITDKKLNMGAVDQIFFTADEDSL